MRPRGDDDPPEPEIETIRNRWDRAWDLGSPWITAAFGFLTTLVAGGVVAGWLGASLVVRIVVVGLVIVVLIGIGAFYLGRKFAYHSMSIEIERKTRERESPYDQDDERDDRKA